MDNFIDFENEILEAEIQNLEDEIDALTPNRKPYTIHACPNPMDVYTENEFR